MRRLWSPKGGFTLVEILVVVGILAVLTAILLPVFLQSRAKSRATVCISNMRSIGQALRMYVDSNDGYWPGRMAAFSFFKDHRNIGKCPDFSPVKLTIIPEMMFLYKDFIPTGYAFNAELIAEPSNIPEIPGDLNPPTLDSKLPFPAVTISVAETSTSEQPLTAWLDKKLRGTRHNSGSHFLFCDGHVKWYRPEAVGDTNDMMGNNGTRPTFDLGINPARGPQEGPVVD